jgi:hypothetical protein
VTVYFPLLPAGLPAIYNLLRRGRHHPNFARHSQEHPGLESGEMRGEGQ